MALDNLNALLIEQLQDIYYAEKQLVKALPKMAKAANAEELSTAFTNHLEETRGHVTRLEEAFEALGVTAKAKKCPAIEGLIEEGSEMMEEEGDESVLDAGLIASAQRVEHYEIAAYGNARSFAEALGNTRVVALLEQTLGEEHAADELLSSISMDSVIPAALTAGNGEAGAMEEDEDEGMMGEEEEDSTTSRPKGGRKGRRSPAKK
jgi:ferritin-like metal-binding protein YciE